METPFPESTGKGANEQAQMRSDTNGSSASPVHADLFPVGHRAWVHPADSEDHSDSAPFSVLHSGGRVGFVVYFRLSWCS